MLRTTIAACALFTSIGFLAAPLAAADADHMTNHDVAAKTDGPKTPTPYKVTIPEAASGGQGPFDHFDSLGNPTFDDGLSDSSRDMLERIRQAPAPVAAEAPSTD